MGTAVFRMLLALGGVAAFQPAATLLPAVIQRQLPVGYDVLADVSMTVAAPQRRFRIVALGRHDEDYRHSPASGAKARPLLIFAENGANAVLIGRNDHVILKADEGGQCDPFLDGDATITVKDRFFTVENGVACGNHWTDYITFRLDDREGFVFDNERSESWSLNTSDAPNAEALVRDGPQHVRRDPPGRRTTFSAWRPDDGAR